MPIKLPDLDDREFADLVAEAKTMIPQLAPAWTDHNTSDPGITLIELFAFICEMLMYRTNRVTDANKRVFLELLMGEKWLLDEMPDSAQTLNQQIAAAMKRLRLEERAISNEDFEKYALKVDKVARAYCRPLRNYQAETNKLYESTPAHISLVIVANENPFDPELIKAKLAQQIENELENRKLLTTWLHVVPAIYLELGVNFTLIIFNDYKEEDIEERALKSLDIFLHPITGGMDGKGWKLGQSVYLADIYALLDQLPGVDYIEPLPDKSALVLDANATQPASDRAIKAGDTDNMIGIRLLENELLQFKKECSKLTIKRAEN